MPGPLKAAISILRQVQVQVQSAKEFPRGAHSQYVIGAYTDMSTFQHRTLHTAYNDEGVGRPHPNPPQSLVSSPTLAACRSSACR